MEEMVEAVVLEEVVSDLVEMVVMEATEVMAKKEEMEAEEVMVQML